MLPMKCILRGIYRIERYLSSGGFGNTYLVRNMAFNELYAMKAVMSIYGVDLLQDNVEACRERLFEIFDKEYSAVCKKAANDEYREVIRYVLSQNILCGNALSLRKVDAKGIDTEDYIVFPEWTFPRNDSKVKRRDFELGKMIDDKIIPPKPTDEDQYSFSLDDEWEYDEKSHAFIPKPVREYPIIHYRRIIEHE